MNVTHHFHGPPSGEQDFLPDQHNSTGLHRDEAPGRRTTARRATKQVRTNSTSVLSVDDTVAVTSTEQEQWFLYGVTSYGDVCGMKYGVYQRVSAFVDWIKQVTEL